MSSRKPNLLRILLPYTLNGSHHLSQYTRVIPIRIMPSSLEGDKMYKISRTILAIFVFFLTACGSSSGLQPGSTASEDTLSTETQLILGTLKLGGTEQAVTTDQAKELLVMWQVYQELNSSGTAAQAEIDGLLEQIQETMTAEQVTAISAMNLTQKDVFALVQEHEAGMGQSQRSSNNTSQSNGGFTPPDGSMAGISSSPDGGMAGAPPVGDLGDMGGAGPSTSTGQSQTTGAGPGVETSAGVPTALVDTLIQYLEQVASA
jgi:hypothetical protein